MKFRSLFGNPKITFTVYGKPPQKSEWGAADLDSIIKLRETALKARNDAGYSESIQGEIQLHVVVFSPITYDRNIAQHQHLGDLDSLVAGICDYIHKGPINDDGSFKPNPKFNDHPEIGPDKSIIIEDDSQITKIIAEKKESNQTYYKIKINLI